MRNLVHALLAAAFPAGNGVVRTDAQRRFLRAAGAELALMAAIVGVTSKICIPLGSWTIVCSPMPPAGGMPYFREVRKSSSTLCCSSLSPTWWWKCFSWMSGSFSSV